jgi:hypothetical protein
MSPRTQVIGVVMIILALVLIVELVRRRRLRTGYSLLWIFTGLVVLVLAVSTGLVEHLTELLGVRSPGSMLFAAGILFTLLLLLEHSLALSTLWHDNKCLTQEVALLEWRIRRLEASLDSEAADPTAGLVPEEEPGSDPVLGSKEEVLEPAI